MSELDIETLKHRVDKMATGGYGPLGLTVREWQWMKAALEDRDRLRAATQKLVENFMFDVRSKAGQERYGVIHKRYVDTLRAAAERSVEERRDD